MSGRLVVAANLIKLLLLLAGVCAALGALGWWLGGYRTLSIVVFGVLLTAAAGYWYSERAVMGMLGARELPPGEAPALHSMVERLAAAARVAKPRLYLLPDGHPRAASAGRGPSSSALAVSRGLLGALPPAELEGVVAHELAHVRARDVLVQSIGVVLATSLVELSRIGGFFSNALLFVLGPVAAATEHVLLSPKRELSADRMAALLCGSPHGLADALIRLERAGELVEFEANPATEPLYTVNPFAPEGLANLFVTHPPLAERVQRLRSLDPEWRERRRAA